MTLKLWIYSNPLIHLKKKNNSLGISRSCISRVKIEANNSVPNY